MPIDTTANLQARERELRAEVERLRAQADRLEAQADRLEEGPAADVDFAMYTAAGNAAVAREVDKLVAQAETPEQAVELFRQLERTVARTHREVIDTAVGESIIGHLIDRGVFSGWDHYNDIACSL